MESFVNLTGPYLVYWTNLRRFFLIFDAVTEHTQSSAKAVRETVGLFTERLRSGEEQKWIARGLEAIENKAGDREETLGMTTLWSVPMLATCLETYMKDILVYAAAKDPSWMADSEQPLSYRSVLESSDIDTLRLQMRRVWAHQRVDGAGPTKWIERFAKRNISGYRVDCALNLEEMRAVRNLVIHRAGIITVEFKKIVTAFADQAAQGHLKLRGPDLVRYFQACADFVETTDKGIRRLYPSGEFGFDLF